MPLIVLIPEPGMIQLICAQSVEQSRVNDVIDNLNMRLLAIKFY